MIFTERTKTKKGIYAENIIDVKLQKRGWILYAPVNENKAHSFDRLCIKDKKVCMVAEVKAKAKRKFYPDTGINYSHYLDYKRMCDNHNLDTFLFFVDEEAGEIYGNYLSVLEKENTYFYNNQNIVYPMIKTTSNGVKIIYFHISLMLKIAKLDKEEIEILKNNTTKQDKYLPK